jgi:hydroxymethylbilane synthase
MTNRPFILASRGSRLALWQANFVAEMIRDMGQAVEIKTWKTTGDIVQDRFLHEIGGKGLFIKELEEAMQTKQADFAVHSLKDMPARIPSNFELTAVLKRHSYRDVIIFKKDVANSIGLPEGSIVNSSTLKSLGPLTIATSSLRRTSLLVGSCPDINTIPVRGNVDTRLQKLERESWHAIILAEASLQRLNITDVAAHPIDPTWFIPCAGQGALAIESLRQSTASNFLKSLECNDTRLAVDIERSVLAALGGDCTMPFGCLVTTDDKDPNKLSASAILLSNNGQSATAKVQIPKNSSDLSLQLERRILSELRQNGANDILKALGLSFRL